MIIGKGPEWRDNAVNAGHEALGGAGAGALIGGRFDGGLAESAVSGALDAGRPPGAGAGAAVPAAPHGSRWTWARITAAALAVPTSLVLFGSLGAGDPARGATAARIADADHVIKELPVVAVTRSAVEAQLTGRTPTPGSSVFVAFLWAVLAAVALFVATALAGPPRRARRVGESWVALRATVQGPAEHVEPPKEGEPGKGAGGRNSPARYEYRSRSTPPAVPACWNSVATGRARSRSVCCSARSSRWPPGHLLLPVDGGWRVWTAVADALAPLLVWRVAGLFTAPAAKGAAAEAEAGPAA
ncbi:hypothetical protein [Streptomyces sp. NPDC058989]|uniref:hypothetical protein n=1 Tax=Streptomyces sp. NPDC058989 TaxID=3346686 RepID=UPI0036B3946B